MRYERGVRPWAGPVDGASNQLLARTALAADEDGGAFGAGDLGDQPADMRHGIALADDIRLVDVR